MSNEPTQERAIVASIREWLPGVNQYALSYEQAVAIIDAALAAEYMRGVMETSGACPTCGATKTEQCHCGEIDEVEL